jgi:hypothetical protein
MSAEYKDLRKLQGLFLRPRKVLRTEAVETQLKSNNVYNTIYQSGKSKEAGAWLGAVPKTSTTSATNSDRTLSARPWGLPRDKRPVVSSTV